MALPANFKRAALEIEGAKGKGPSRIECLFNPKEYSISKSNTWNATPTPGKTATPPQFGGGAPYEMSLQLLFDASLLGDGKDVVSIVRALFDAMNAEHAGEAKKGKKGNNQRPAKVKFIWGPVIGFDAFVKSIKVQYQLFAADGQPLRVTVDLSLMQADMAPPLGQNPTTRADASLGTHEVRDGDTLPAIAYSTYGDPTRWRELAQANGIDDPLRLRRGAVLALPLGDG